jgi:hypothetical protein
MTTPSHETLREQLLDLAYGELDRRAARALERHLQGCAECRAELQRMTSTRSAMSALSDVPAPDQGEAILIAAARETARGREAARRPFLPAWLWGASLGAVSLVAVAVLSVKLAGEPPPPGLRRSGDELVAVAPTEREVAPAPAPEPAAAAQAKAPAQPASEAEPAPAAPAVDALADKRAKAGLARGEMPAARPARQAPERSFAQAPAARDDAGTRAPRRGDEDLALGGAPLGALGSGDGGGLGGKGGLGLDGEADLQPSRGAGARAEKKKDAVKERFAAAPPAEPTPAPATARPPPPPTTAAPDAAAAATAAREAKELHMDAGADAAGAGREAAALDELAEATPAANGPARGALVARSEGEAPGPTALRRDAPGAPGEDPIARHARLHAAGRLRTVTRTFAGCAAEAARVVELDEAGRVVKLTRRGTYRDEPFEVELFYGEDGLLGAARWRSGGKVREVRAGPPGTSMSAAGIPAAALQPQRAADAGPDVAPRCGL